MAPFDYGSTHCSEGEEHWPQGLFSKPSGTQSYFEIQKAGLPYPSSLYPTFREDQGVAFNPIKLFFMDDVKVTQVETLSKAPVRLFEKQ